MEGHSSFIDGDSFIKNGGQKGPQIEIIPPGSYRINPYLFKVTKSTATKISEGEIGLVESADGSAIPAGRIFANMVTGHNSLQSGEDIITNGGQKGTQIDVLLPGTYRINLNLFRIQIAPATIIEANQVGLGNALDGIPLPEREYVACPITGHNDYQDGSAFLTKHGQRGPQLDVLRPGDLLHQPVYVQC